MCSIAGVIGAGLAADDVQALVRGMNRVQAHRGPDGAGMDPPPADFSAPHTRVHSDQDLVYWVRSGKQGTGMPGFDAVLSEGGR